MVLYRLEALFAGVTQLVECQLPKLNVASSSLVARSILLVQHLAVLERLLAQHLPVLAHGFRYASNSTLQEFNFPNLNRSYTAKRLKIGQPERLIAFWHGSCTGITVVRHTRSWQCEDNKLALH